MGQIFAGFIVNSNLNNMKLLTFLGKIPETRIIFFKFSICRLNIVPKPTDQSCSNSISRVLLHLSAASPFHFRPILNVKGSSHKKQETE